MMKSLSAAYIPFADSAAPMYWQAVAVGIASRNGQVKSAGGNLLLGSISAQFIERENEPQDMY